MKESAFWVARRELPIWKTVVVNRPYQSIDLHQYRGHAYARRMAKLPRWLTIAAWAVFFYSGCCPFLAGQAAAAERLPDTAVCRLGSAEDENWSHGVYETAFSPDGRLAAIRSSDQVIRIWDLRSQRMIRELPEFAGGIKEIVFSHNSQFLAAAGDPDTEATDTLWTVADGKPVELASSAPGVNSRGEITHLVRRSTKPGNLVYVAHNKIHERSLVPPRDLEPRDFSNLGSKAKPLAISPDHSRVIIGRPINRTFPAGRSGVPNQIQKYILDVVNLTAKQSEDIPFEPFDLEVRKCKWSPNGRDIAIIFREAAKAQTRKRNQILFRDVNNSTFKLARGGHTAAIQDLAFSPDGRHLASVSVDGKLRIWDMLTRSVITEIDEGLTRRLVSVSFSPDGRYLATGSAGPKDNSAIVWDWKKLLLANIARKPVESPWDSLTKRTATDVYPAIKQLVESPQSTLLLLHNECGAAEADLTREQIDEKIAELSHPSYAVRTAAHEALSRVRVTAASQLREVLQRGTAPFETDMRLKKLLSSAAETGEFNDEQKRQLLRGVFVLELIGDGESLAVLHSIASRHPYDAVRESAAASADRLEKNLDTQDVR